MNKSVVEKLNKILEWEISGVVRYLHYSLMVVGPNRIPIIKWFRDQALDAFEHASIIGEKITSYGGHPSLRVSAVPETKSHSVMEILKESLEFEQGGLKMYEEVLAESQNNIALEELIRDMIRKETEHVDEVRKMLMQQN